MEKHIFRRLRRLKSEEFSSSGLRFSSVVIRIACGMRRRDECGPKSFLRGRTVENFSQNLQAAKKKFRLKIIKNSNFSPGFRSKIEVELLIE
jgi:hypothetical protein